MPRSRAIIGFKSPGSRRMDCSPIHENVGQAGPVRQNASGLLDSRPDAAAYQRCKTSRDCFAPRNRKLVRGGPQGVRKKWGRSDNPRLRSLSPGKIWRARESRPLTPRSVVW